MIRDMRAKECRSQKREERRCESAERQRQRRR
jgi:hypothetical protein